MNNYTRGDYTADDYYYVKQMNLLIHQWDLPSVNVLGAIDDGEGHWATGYMQDNWHPTTNGHKEFLYAMPPSLFDAIAAGKPQPVRDLSKSMTLEKKNVISFTGEGTVHPFTISVRVKGSDEGQLFSFMWYSTQMSVSVNAEGKVVFGTSTADMLTSSQSINDGQWHLVTLTFYNAQRRTLLYVDGVSAGEHTGRMGCGRFTIGDADSEVSRQFSELFFWRSALSPEEVQAVCDGKMLKSSLEIYSPLSDDEKEQIVNKAQTLNEALYETYVPSGIDMVGANDAAVDANAYNIVGQRVDNTYRGIVIQSGRKTIVR